MATPAKVAKKTRTSTPLLQSSTSDYTSDTADFSSESQQSPSSSPGHGNSYLQHATFPPGPVGASSSFPDYHSSSPSTPLSLSPAKISLAQSSPMDKFVSAFMEHRSFIYALEQKLKQTESELQDAQKNNKQLEQQLKDFKEGMAADTTAEDCHAALVQNNRKIMELEGKGRELTDNIVRLETKNSTAEARVEELLLEVQQLQKEKTLCQDVMVQENEYLRTISDLHSQLQTSLNELALVKEDATKADTEHQLELQQFVAALKEVSDNLMLAEKKKEKMQVEMDENMKNNKESMKKLQQLNSDETCSLEQVSINDC